MKAKKFVEVYGLHNLVVQTALGLDTTTIKSTLDGVDSNSICYVTCDKADEAFGYKGEYILTKGMIFPCKETIGLESDLKELSGITGEFISEANDKFVDIDDSLSSLNSEVNNINDLIPSTATPSNKLTDVDFVNSSIATSTATFRGTWHIKNNLGLEPEEGESWDTVAQALNNFTGITFADKNDYTFVFVPGHDYQSGSTTIRVESRFDKYKFSETLTGTTWEYEYSLNNSSFTAAQWAAINSNMTDSLRQYFDTWILEPSIHVTTAQTSDWDSKASQTYVDTELDKKSDKVTTYTKIETETRLNSKQDTLIAGSGIIIDAATNTISATAAEPYDDTEIRGLISGETANRISGDNVLQTEIDGLSSSKQDALTAGQNIDITSNVVSAKGYVFNDTIKSFAEGDSIARGDNSHSEGKDTEVGLVESIQIIKDEFEYEGEIYHYKTAYDVELIKYSTVMLYTDSGATQIACRITESVHDTEGECDRFNTDVEISSGYYYYANKATGAHAEGIGTKAIADGQHVCGKYNQYTGTNDTIFIIGNGSNDANRSNAFWVNKDGSANAQTSFNAPTINEGGVSLVNKYAPISDGVPVGSVMMWIGENAPDGWLLCDGHTIPVYTEETSGCMQVYLKCKNINSGTIEWPNALWINNKYDKLLTLYHRFYGTTVGSGGRNCTIIGIYRSPSGTMVVMSSIDLHFLDLTKRFPLGASSDSAWACGNQVFDTTLGSTGGENGHQLTIDEMPRHNHVDYLDADDKYTSTHSGVSGGSRVRDYSENGTTSDTGNDNFHNNIPPYLALNFIIKYK